MKSEINRDGQQAETSPARQERTAQYPHSILVRGFSTKRAAEYLGISESYLKAARKKKKPKTIVGPKFTRLGKKCIYLREDLEAYLSEAKQAFHSD